jgi:hypothetical protein
MGIYGCAKLQLFCQKSLFLGSKLEKKHKKYMIFTFFFENIWSCPKKAVPLHSLSPKNRENAEKRWFEAPEKLKQFDL